MFLLRVNVLERLGGYSRGATTILSVVNFIVLGESREAFDVKAISHIAYSAPGYYID